MIIVPCKNNLLENEKNISNQDLLTNDAEFLFFNFEASRINVFWNVQDADFSLMIGAIIAIIAPAVITQPKRIDFILCSVRQFHIHF